MLHAAWALGAAWPAQDRQALAAAVAGTRQLPGPAACWTVSGALAVAAGVTAGAGGDRPVAVAARVGVVTALLLRAVTGVTGQTHRLVSWTPSLRFVDLDRRWYGPVCGVLAGSRPQAYAARTGDLCTRTARARFEHAC